MKKPKKTYSELLKHPKWQKKRLEVLERENFKCEWCGDGESTLNVHHGYYQKDCKPWEYPVESLHCLCEKCHTEVGRIIKKIKQQLGMVNMSGMLRILGFVLGASSFLSDVKINSTDDIGLIAGFGEYFGVSRNFMIRKLEEKKIIKGGWDLVEIIAEEGWGQSSEY